MEWVDIVVVVIETTSDTLDCGSQLPWDVRIGAKEWKAAVSLHSRITAVSSRDPEVQHHRHDWTVEYVVVLM
jgi:hypothetical protein